VLDEGAWEEVLTLDPDDADNLQDLLEDTDWMAMPSVLAYCKRSLAIRWAACRAPPCGTGRYRGVRVSADRMAAARSDGVVVA
jgi:hypothetical protein